LRSSSCIVGAFKNHRDYHELRGDLEHLSR
jgi:hypothetical protein